MAKRLLDLSNQESMLRKRIKLENKLILDKLKDIHEEIDINEYEVEKFLLIFHTLMETVNFEEVLDNTDSAITDAILKIVLRLSEFLKNNIDSLKLSDIFKIALRKIKSLFNLQTDQDAEHTGEAEKTSEATGNGSEEHEQQANKTKKKQNKKIFSTTKKR